MAWFSKTILFAWVSVDLESGKTNILIADETDHSPSTIKYKTFSNDSFQKILTTLDVYLSKHKIENCSLEITQMKDYWHVLVFSTISSKYIDEFGIDENNRVIAVPDPISK